MHLLSALVDQISVECKYYYMIFPKNSVGGRGIGEALVHTTRERHNFHYFGAVIKCVIQPIVMAMATEKIGITATDGRVHIVTATENKNDFICRCRHSVK